MCAATCQPGLTNCSNACVDEQIDDNNCGMCGTTCDPGQHCVAGKCTADCAPPWTSCPTDGGTSCVNLNSDPNNCGQCGNACPMGNFCTPPGDGGPPQCGLACFGGTTKCGNKCVDTKIDPQNCGGCGIPCNGTCYNSVCCPNNQIYCKGMCQNASNCYPTPCTAGKDKTGSDYVICAMDSTGAWIAGNNDGNGCTYGALAICQSYGFSKVTRWGGTCGNICGYCGKYTCQNQQGVYTLGGGYTTFDSGGGNPQMGANISCTVHWECAP
jgi:hypothetical protein